MVWLMYVLMAKKSCAPLLMRKEINGKLKLLRRGFDARCTLNNYFWAKVLRQKMLIDVTPFYA